MICRVSIAYEKFTPYATRHTVQIPCYNSPMNKTNFWLGLLFGILVGLIIWYWQKSTSAEEGALALLDKLADAETRFKKSPVRETAVPPQTPPTPPVDLEIVKGIGSVFAARLRQQGVNSLEALSQLTPDQLAVLLDIGEKRAETILSETRKML